MSVVLNFADADAAAVPQTAPANFAAQIHTTADAITMLRPRWRALEAAADGVGLFQSEAWCNHVMSVRGCDGAAILTVSDGGALVALLPLRITGGPAGRVATGFGEPFQQYSEMLVSPGNDPATMLRLMLDTLRAGARPDAIMLHKVRADSKLHAGMTAYGADGRANPFIASTDIGGAPFTDLRPYGDFADFHATVSFKSRKNLRNARNRLARNGELRVLVDDSGEGLAAAIAGSHAGRLDWLDREGQISRAFADPAFPALLESFAHPGESGLGLLAVTIKVGDSPVAYQWGFLHRRRYYAYVASWAPEYEEFSPGKMIMEEVLKACHDRGIAVADFLMPASRYKFTWATGAVEVRDWSAPLTLRGQAIALWTSRLRPALKPIYLKMPGPLRTFARMLMKGGA